ncbi:hypothetical protein [Bremerella sp. P1]|uniref:hypothetical protein n=1 Tax=Bremerella sp. P1 TaxID=3026424 RepID=UPI0023689963|nr:hypothetical protein [Bremerella sp. P1]WDI43737.1 hypothetical protein PSR63_07225 [Bremerella sp. P1]
MSGIIIVMVLLLSLELVERPEQDSQRITSSVATDVESAITEAEAELETLQGSVQELNTLISNIAETSPSELQNEIDSLRRRIDEKEQGLKQLHAQEEQLKEEKKDVLVQQFDRKDEREELDKVTRELADLQTQLEQERDEDRLVFTLPKGSKKSGWLVVVDSGRIDTAPIGRESRPIRFTSSSSGFLGTDTAVNQFMEWARDRNASSSYFLVLVRPSGASAFDQLESRLSLSGIQFGFDLIGENQSVLHPERGAAP